MQRMQQDIYARNWQKAREQALKSGLGIVDYGWEQHVIIDEKAGITYRYPRHKAGADKLADEVAVLRDIHLRSWPIDLPVMLEHNEAFTSYRYIAGEVLTEDVVSSLQAEDFEQIGRDLGEFLALFHQLDFAIVSQKQTSHSTSLFEYYANRINGTRAEDFKKTAQKTLFELEKYTGKSKNVVLHGDLHGPNVVINPDTKQLKGVIDLSEIEIGDPHQEFRKVFMTFPGALEESLKGYAAKGGQKPDKQTIILWAYTNEWANLCYFADDTSNYTYQRAYKHLKKWEQL